MDAIDLILEDHRNAEALFRRYESTDDPQEKRRVVDSIIEELSVHAAIEEQELYPVMAELPDGEDLVAEAIQEHLEAKLALAVLDRLEPDDRRFEDKARELIADVRHHVEEEETELLPQLREHLGPDRLDDLAERLERARSNAPTRPSADDLAKATGDQLYEAAQVLDLTGRSDMDKEQLAKELAGR